MSHKIKIAISFVFSIYLCTSCAFDGDINLYDIKINDWATVSYFVDRNSGSTVVSFIRMYDKPPKSYRIDQKEDISSNDLNERNQIIGEPISILYDDTYIWASEKNWRNNDTLYYKIEGRYADDNITPIGYIIADTISKIDFDLLKIHCADCKILDKERLRIQDEETEANRKSSNPYTLFVSIIIFTINKIRDI